MSKKPTPKVAAAYRLMHEMREMLNDIAASACILGSTPFDGSASCRKLSGALNTALLEFETEIAALGHLTFETKKDTK